MMNENIAVPCPTMSALLRRLARQVEAGVSGPALDALIRHELLKVADGNGHFLPKASDTRTRRPSTN